MVKSLFLLLLIVLGVGCIELPAERSICDTILEEYISEIDPTGVGEYADEMTGSCSNDECKASEIYWWVTDNIRYIPDPADEEQIQSPEETIRREGGDCEDISILMASLLMAMKIDANPIFVENHTLLLVCGLDPEGIKRETARRIVRDYWVEANGNLYFDGEGGVLELDYMNEWNLSKNGIAYVEPEGYLHRLQVSCDRIDIDYEIRSDSEVNFLFIDNELEFQNYVHGKEYKSITEGGRKNFNHTTGSCSVKRGRFIVENRGSENAEVNVNLDIKCRMKLMEIQQFITYLFSRNNISMRFYGYRNATCMFFEASLQGEGFSYPGYLAEYGLFQEESYIINLPEGTCERFYV